MNHIIYTRFRYNDEKEFDYRFDLFCETMLLSLLLQKNRNFHWQIQTTSRDKPKIEEMIEDLSVEFLIQDDPSHQYWGKYLFSYDPKWKIQSRLDSDDIVDPLYIDMIQKIANDIGDEKNMAVNFEYRRMRWKDKKYSRAKSNCKIMNRCSMFLSLINPDGLTVNTGKHHQMAYNAKRVIWVTDQKYATLVIHGRNKSSKFLR
jgi:hypothetical protein